MALSAEKERLAKAIDGYLASKRDEGKKVIANNCKAAIALALNHRELLAVLESYREELLRLVGKKNARRWFKHKPGELDDILRKGIERVRVQANNETRIFTMTAPNKNLTVRDWNRHNGGKSYVVNGRPFTGTATSPEDIDAFLRTAGIFSARLREYLCEYANQDGLFSAGHLFSAACVSRGVIASYAGARHVYRNGRRVDRIHCREEAFFGTLTGSDGASVILDPPLTFVQLYDLVERNGEIAIMEARYEIENLESLPPELRDVVRFAFGQVIP